LSVAISACEERPIIAVEIIYGELITARLTELIVDLILSIELVKLCVELLLIGQLILVADLMLGA